MLNVVVPAGAEKMMLDARKTPLPVIDPAFWNVTSERESSDNVVGVETVIVEGIVNP